MIYIQCLYLFLFVFFPKKGRNGVVCPFRLIYNYQLIITGYYFSLHLKKNISWYSTVAAHERSAVVTSDVSGRCSNLVWCIHSPRCLIPEENPLAAVTWCFPPGARSLRGVFCVCGNFNIYWRLLVLGGMGLTVIRNFYEAGGIWLESVKVPFSQAAACSVGRVKDALGSCGSLRQYALVAFLGKNVEE